MYRNSVIYLLLTLSMTVNAAIGANTLRFNHLTVDNGLSQNSVHAIIKGTSGLVSFL